LIDIFLLQVSKNTRLEKGAPGGGIRPSESDSMAAAVEWMYSEASPGEGLKASC
jgi:hypothetical protein